MKNDKVAPTPRTAGIALWTLTAVYTLSFLDRQIIAILAEEIKRDLELSDAEVGLITGFAFALFYATLGVPIARAADFRSRPKIIAVCLTIWSVMTAACGLAANFVQLALARIGVGVGEAGCMPPAHSLIAEMFPPEKRSGAMAIFQLGVPLGILLGFLIGGWVNEFFGWRYSLLVVGGPGAFLALWVLFAVPEPRASGTIRADGPPFLKTAAKLWKDPVYRHLVAGATFASMAGYAAISWTPAMLIRQYELGTGYVGTVLSIVIGVGGAVGLYWGGKVGDAASTRLSSGPYKVAAVACFVAAPAFGAAYLASSIMATILLLAGAFILAFAWMGPNWAMVQERAPGEGRAVAASIVLLFINLIGLGVGPPVVGALSDMLSSYGSSSGLRFALLVAPLAFALAGIHFTLEPAPRNRTRETPVPIKPLELTQDDVGKEIGVSDWVTFGQDDINLFARATRDLDRMHIDPAWAKKNSPFGAPIAFGFQTLSMLTYFSHLLLDWGDEEGDDVLYGLNYGFDRVRFVAPLRVDTPFRCRMMLAGLEERGEGKMLARFGVEIEARDQPKPVLTAEWLSMFVTEAGDRLITKKSA